MSAFFAGTTLGICNCCPKCAKVEGESCGGQHDYLGRCDAGTRCVSKAAIFAQRLVSDAEANNFVGDGADRETLEMRRHGGICQRGQARRRGALFTEYRVSKHFVHCTVG